jgi:repressor LexA
VSVPVLGRIAAGPASLATADDVDGYIAVPMDYAPDGAGHFALRVRGGSMTGAGIFDGDTVIVRGQDAADEGDIVVALLPGAAEDEATVKRLRGRGEDAMLVPENPAMDPFPLGEGRILGRVVAVLRKL